MYWDSWVRDSLVALRDLRIALGFDATLPGAPGGTEGKRQTIFEEKAVKLIMSRLPSRTALEAEGYDPSGPADAKWIVGLDPTDGTAGDARFGGVGQLATGLPVSCVLAVRENVPNPTFGSVKYAGILDLHDGQIFYAGEDGAYVMGVDNVPQKLSRTPQYNVHAPAIATEIARRANAFLRFLIPYGVYPEMYADSHSSATVMLWSLMGYCDAWFNCNLPGIEGAGQRGHELGAISVFARALGAYAVRTSTIDNWVTIVGLLDVAPYTFDGQTSVILGVDEVIVWHYMGLINDGLSREITLNANGQEITLPVAQILAELHAQYPGERWSLPLVPSISA